MADKSNDILSLPDLLDPLDLDGKVVTADAIHTQTNPAQWIRDRGDHNVVMVKNNQKTLHRTLKALPWKSVPSTYWVDTGHGRWVRLNVKAVEAPDWVDFLATAEVVQVRCTRTTKIHKSTAETARLRQPPCRLSIRVCSLPMADAQPEAIAAWLQSHWAIENRFRWFRKDVFDEDRHQLHTRNEPEIMAALRDLAISLIHLFHCTRATIASITRSLSRQPKRAIRLLTQPTS